MFKTAHIWVSVIPVLALFQTAHSGSLDVRQDAVQGRAVATMNDNFRRLENEKIDKKQLLNEMKTLGVISVSTATVLSELTASSATVTNTLTVGGIVPSSDDTIKIGSPTKEFLKIHTGYVEGSTGIDFVINGSTRAGFISDGTFFVVDNVSHLGIGSGTAPGSIVSGHNRFFRSVNYAGTGTVRVIGINNGNIWVIGGENTGSASLIGRDARNNTPDAASVTVDGVAQAWVIINGSGGTPAINGGAANSNNVASITDNGVGDWTINFRRDMADADYAVTLGNGRVSDGVIAIPFVNSRTASGVTIKITKLDGTATDADYISVVVHGRLGVTTAN
jgi:hypothetical protein